MRPPCLDWLNFLSYYGNKPVPLPIFYHKSYRDWPGIEPGASIVNWIRYLPLTKTQHCVATSVVCHFYLPKVQQNHVCVCVCVCTYIRRIRKKTELLLQRLYCSFYSVLSTVPFKVVPSTGYTVPNVSSIVRMLPRTHFLWWRAVLLSHFPESPLWFWYNVLSKWF